MQSPSLLPSHWWQHKNYDSGSHNTEIRCSLELVRFSSQSYHYFSTAQLEVCRRISLIFLPLTHTSNNTQSLVGDEVSFRRCRWWKIQWKSMCCTALDYNTHKPFRWTVIGSLSVSTLHINQLRTQHSQVYTHSFSFIILLVGTETDATTIIRLNAWHVHGGVTQTVNVKWACKSRYLIWITSSRVTAVKCMPS